MHGLTHPFEASGVASAFGAMGTLARFLILPLCALIFLAGYITGIAICSAIAALVR